MKPEVFYREEKVCFGAVLDDSFVKAVDEMRKRLGWQTHQLNHILACMAFETGGKFSPSIKNLAGSGATGLIQFMPRTAKGLGTTVNQLSEMTAIEQLKYVEKYFKPYAKRITTLPDMYMAILMPKYVGKPSSTVMFNTGTTAYRQNSGLDQNKDGKITKREASRKVREYLKKGMSSSYSATHYLKV